MKNILLLCIFFIASCSMNATAPDTAPVADPREQELRGILTEAEPLIRNLLTSLNTGVYASYSRDFDTTLQTAAAEEQFSALQEKIKKKLGMYENGKYQVHKIEQYTTGYLIVYFVKFQNVDRKNPAIVNMRVKKTAAGLKITDISCKHSLLESRDD
jgi:hypothetical protein